MGESASNDESILQMVKGLPQLLNTRPFNPTRIEWIDYFPTKRGGIGTPVEADQPIIGRRVLTLPYRFKDKLTADEWRPLFSSMLIRIDWTRKRRRWTLLLFAAAASGTFALVHFLLSPPPILEPVIGFLAVIGSVFIVGVGLSPLLRKELFEADKQTASNPGTSNLLQVLQKLEAAEEDQSRPGLLGPSIKRRIENLQSF